MYSFKHLLTREPAALASIVSAAIAIITIVAVPVSPELTAAIVGFTNLVLGLAYVRPRVTPTAGLAEPDIDESN